jgi:hypothetical protein
MTTGIDLSIILAIVFDFILTKQVIDKSAKLIPLKDAIDQEWNILARYLFKKFGTTFGMLLSLLISIMFFVMVFQYLNENLKWGIFGSQCLMIMTHLKNIDSLNEYIKQKESVNGQMVTVPKIDFQLNQEA